MVPEAAGPLSFPTRTLSKLDPFENAPPLPLAVPFEKAFICSRDVRLREGRVVKEYHLADQVSCKPGAQNRDQHGWQERQAGGCNKRDAQGD